MSVYLNNNNTYVCSLVTSTEIVHNIIKTFTFLSIFHRLRLEYYNETKYFKYDIDLFVLMRILVLLLCYSSRSNVINYIC